jgi:OOP family OmpA-OmpF porin
MDFTSDGVAPAPATNYENTKFGWKAGAGIGYEFESNVGFRAEWERYRVDDARGEKYFVDVYSASVLYRF